MLSLFLSEAFGDLSKAPCSMSRWLGGEQKPAEPDSQDPVLHSVVGFKKAPTA